MNIKQETGGADNGGHTAMMIRQDETPITTFAALLPANPTEAEKNEPVPSDIQTSVTHFNDHGEPLCASEKVKQLVEVACPDRWLLPLINRAGGTNGIVKLSYGCGYETIVFVGNAKARDAPTGRVSVGITVNRANATIKDIGDVCVSGSEILWNCMPRSDDPPPCLFLRTSNQRFMIPPLSAKELLKRSRMIRVWPANDDPNALERMEDVIDPKSFTAASRPTGGGIGDAEDEPKKKKKAKKDPNMPKQGRNAYNFYLEENVERARADNPDAKYTEIREKLTEEYKNLGEEDKAKYINMAEVDKKKQDRAIADYLATHPPKDDDDDDDDDDDEKPKKKAQRQKKDPNAPKNKMNAFLYWSKDQRPALKAANPDVPFQEFNKLLSTTYKALSEEELAPYQALADADKERYDAEMKAYKESKDKPHGNEKPAAQAEHEEDESVSVEAASLSKSKKRKSSEATDDATEENETAAAAPAHTSSSKKKKKKKKKKHRKSE